MGFNFRNVIKFAQSKLQAPAPAPTGAPTGEYATRAAALGFRGFINHLPNPDPVLKSKGIDISTYRDLMSDPALAGGILSRKAALLSLEWGFDRGKARSRTAKAVESHFKNNLDINSVIGEMFEGALFGYAPMEVVSQGMDGLWLPQKIIGKPQTWFQYDPENRLRFRRQGTVNGELIEDKRFVVARSEASYENPYGIGALSRCFWPTIFRRNGYSFWVQFGERYGMPWTIGKLPRGMDPKEYDALNDVLAAMVQDAIAVVPNDADISFLQSNQTGSVDAFSKLVEHCKADISIIMRGHEGANNSTPGKLGGDDAATKVMDEIRDGDARMCEAAMNEVVRWIYAVNWPNERDIPRFEMWPRKQVDKELADRDGSLATQLGVRFSKEYIADTYGLPPDQFEVEAPKPQPPPEGEPPAPPVAPKGKAKLAAFSQAPPKTDPTGDALDELVASIPAEDLQAFMETMLKPVFALLKKGGTAEEIQARLAEAYPLMDDSALEELLTKAIFVAEALGDTDGSP